MSGVRPFAAGDIPDVARLHQEVFKPEGRTGAAALDDYRDYLREVFLEGPFSDPDLPSLVHEDGRGRISGFVGVAPRRLAVRGKRFQAAVSSQFIVEPGSQAGLIAVLLAKAFLAGPQDVSIADEATDTSRRIWEGLGGAAATLMSLHWTRPLRPARLAASFLQQRGRALASLHAAARPVAAVVDSFATRWPRSQFYQPRTAGAAVELDRTTVPSVVSDLNANEDLHVEYDDRSFGWLLHRAGRTRPGGELIKTVLQDRAGMLGWYVWHLDRHGAAEVIQFRATRSKAAAVLDYLFRDVWQRGAAAVSGRIEPRYLQDLSDKHCLFHRRGPWLLAHARRPELAQAFLSGHVSFSRLDGEWALAF